MGSLRFGNKSVLLVCLEKNSQATIKLPEMNAIALDGTVIVNMLKPMVASPSMITLTKYVSRQLKNVQRYTSQTVSRPQLECSVVKVYNTVQCRVLPDTKVPGNWD